MGKKRRIKRVRNRLGKEKTTAARPAAGRATFRLGLGSIPVYLDAETNDSVAMELADDAPQRVSGYLKHTPSAGTPYAHVREMHIGAPGGPMPEPVRVPEPERPSGRTWVGYDPGLPGRRCACGFKAFLWQKACPKCMRPLQVDPGSGR